MASIADNMHTHAKQVHDGVLRALFVGATLTMIASSHAQQEQWARLVCDSPDFSVSAPPGWVLEPVQNTGARLVAPDADLVVEVVTWKALRPPATAEKAAAQHEALLGHAFDYRRRSEEALVTDQGADYLLVVGAARAGPLEKASVFAAYAFGDAYYVLGTFCEPDEVRKLRASLLDEMARSLRAGPPAVIQPPQVVEDTETVEPAQDRPPTDLQVEPEGRPVLPGPEEQAAPWAEHTHQLGFSVSLPADWRVALTQGRILVGPDPVEPLKHGVVIWPVTGKQAAAEDALSAFLAELPLPGPALTKLFENHDPRGVAVLGAMTGDGLRLLASYASNDGDGLLVVAMAPAEEFERERGRLARVASSFRPGRWMVPVQTGGGEEVTGEAGLLRWRLPPGWQSRGGVEGRGGEAAITIDAVLPGPKRLRVAWHQPLLPGFRKLSALLDSLGWREGDIYGGDELSAGMLVYKRRSPQEFVDDYLLPRHPRSLTDVTTNSEGNNPAVAGLLRGAGAQGAAVLVRGDSTIGPRERLYIVATASMPAPLQETCWQAAELRAEAGEGALREAVAALTVAVESAHVTEQARDARLADPLRALLLSAQRSLEAVPADLRPASAQEPKTSVLEGPTTAAGRSWALPGAVLDFWREQATAPQG